MQLFGTVLLDLPTAMPCTFKALTKKVLLLSVVIRLFYYQILMIVALCAM